MGAIDEGDDCRRGMKSFRGDVGHPIVTNGNLYVRVGGDAALPKLFWEFLLFLLLLGLVLQFHSAPLGVVVRLYSCTEDNV